MNRVNGTTKFNAKTNIHYINIGPYVLAMSFIILSSTFSLFATNILKLYSVIYSSARLHGMPLLILNQFLACSVDAKILPGKHYVAFNLIQLGDFLISGLSIYIVMPSLTGIAYCAYLLLLSYRRYALSPPLFNR